MFFKNKSFNLTLDVLESCKYNCPGCTVDKTYKPLSFDNSVLLDLIRLVKEAKDNDFRLHEITIGSTDISSAVNKESILTNPSIIELLNNYNSVVIALTLLCDDGIVDLCKTLDDIIPTKVLRIGIPMTVKSVKNEKFINLIKQRIQLIKSNLKKCTFNKIYVNFNMNNINADTFTKEINDYIQSLDFGIKKIIEFPFPHARQNLQDPLIRHSFRKDILSFVKGIQGSANTKNNHFLIPEIYDSLEYIYRDNELYYTPVLIEKFPLISEQLKLDKPWLFKSIMDFKEKMYYDNLLKYSNNHECSDCCFLDHCSRGDIHYIMEKMNTEKCIIQMKNRLDLNPHYE